MNNNFMLDFSSTLEPLKDIQKHIATILNIYQLECSRSIEQIAAPLKQINQIIIDTMTPYTEMMESIRQSQQALFNEVAKLNNLHTTLSIDDSLKISDIYTSIVNEVSQENLLDSCDVELVDVKEVDKKPLTLEQLLTIISVIVAIISTVLTRLPDKQSDEIINSLNQLIEIENQQLELLQQMDNDLSD